MYVGDEGTDERAFRVLADQAVTVRGDAGAGTAATYRLTDGHLALRLLSALAEESAGPMNFTLRLAAALSLSALAVIAGFTVLQIPAERHRLTATLSAARCSSPRGSRRP